MIISTDRREHCRPDPFLLVIIAMHTASNQRRKAKVPFAETCTHKNMQPYLSARQSWSATDETNESQRVSQEDGRLRALDSFLSYFALYTESGELFVFSSLRLVSNRVSKSRAAYTKSTQ